MPAKKAASEHETDGPGEAHQEEARLRRPVAPQSGRLEENKTLDQLQAEGSERVGGPDAVHLLGPEPAPDGPMFDSAPEPPPPGFDERA